MVILNFGHPLTSSHVEDIESAVGQQVNDSRTIITQFELDQPFDQQASALADQVGLSSEDWQTLLILVNPPSHSLIALALFAELHGRMGHFPAVIRLRPTRGMISGQFEFAEVIDLQAIRELARQKRSP